MSIPLSGYQTLAQLGASPRARVYAGERVADGAAVVAKVFDIDDEDTEARVAHEFGLLRGLELPGVVRALSLERSGEQLVLLLERIAGSNLAEHAGGRALPALEVARIGAEVAAILARVHARNIVHRDIKPSNLLVEEQGGSMVLADFGISVLVEAEHRHLYDSRLLQGTLPYLSPEQTGRTKRKVDARSDLYSLGVTLYQLATGQLPFTGESALELIHAHLAVEPASPAKLRPQLPERLAAIILRLLAKAPEQRYQTAEGLRVDLERVLDALAAGAEIPPFELGADDRVQRLQLPARLYGRKRELEALGRELNLAYERERPRVTLLAGGPGLGKSALISELEAPLLALGGQLGRGKFEQGGRARPYEAFIQAFGAIFERTLTLPQASLEQLAEQLRESLGGLASVLVELIPALGLVIGEQPPAPDLGPEQARNRIGLAFVRLCGALASEVPLLLVLDDMQWADRASLALLPELAKDTRCGGVMLLVAYRDHELDAGHPLSEMLARLGDPNSDEGPTQLQLHALERAQLIELLADTLGRAPAELDELAELVARKTGGAPLFVGQFLAYLAERSLLRPSSSGWSWELESIARAGIPDDVLGVMTAKLDGLEASERKLLEFSACMGTRFELGLLAAAMKLERSELLASAFELEAGGLIDAAAEGFRFVHERVREAALSELEPEQRREIHAAIGAALVERHGLDGSPESLEALGDEIHELIGQLGAGARADGEAGERELLVRLNREAGQRALRSAAWGLARDYLGAVLELSAGSPALRAMEQSVMHELAQAEAMLGNRPRAAELYDQLLAGEVPGVIRAQIIGRRADILTAQGHVHEAVALAHEALLAHGVKIPREPGLGRVVLAVLRGWSGAGSTTRATLEALPVLEGEQLEALIYSYAALVRASFMVENELFVVTVCELARRFVRLGYNEVLPLTLVQLAVAGCGLGKVAEAEQLCQDAIAVAERRSPGDLMVFRAKLYAGILVWPLARPWTELIPEVLGLHDEALDLGDKWAAGILAAFGLAFHLEDGTHLRELLELHARFERADPGWGLVEMSVFSTYVLRFVQTLSAAEPSEAPGFMSVDELPPEGINPVTRCACQAIAVMGSVLIGDLDQASRLCDAIDGTYEQDMAGTWAAPRHAAYGSIVAARRWAGADRRERRRLRAQLRRNLSLAHKWAKGCATNYQPYVELIEGELATLDGRVERASLALERARELALAARMQAFAAVAGEELARIMSEQGRAATAEGLRRLALEDYRRWGARACVRRLGAQLPEASFEPRRTKTSRTASSATTGTTSIDAEILISTLRALNDELELSAVVTQVLARALVSAGADHGALLLEEEGRVGVVASADTGGTREYLEQPVPVAEAGELVPLTAVNLVLRAGGSVVVDDARLDPRFAHDPYIEVSQLRSLLCMAIVSKQRRVGALVVENRLSSAAFTRERLELLELLASQAASALERARLYDALRRSEAQWRSLVDGVPDLITVLDTQGRVELANQSRPFGRARTQLIGSGLEALLSAEAGAAWQATLASVLDKRRASELEFELEGEAGARSYLVHLGPVFDGEEVVKLIAIARDITARRELEARLRQQQRLESLGTLAAGVAHEINNPLQGIEGFAGLLELSADEPELVREYAADILGETKRVTTLVGDLLGFSRRDEGQAAPFEEVALEGLFESTRALVRSILQRDRIALSVDMPPASLRLRCRSQQLQQILINLITNARDALREHGVGPEGEAPAVHVEARQLELGEDEPRPGLRISVRDNGVGIPAEIVAKIFDPFFTTKPRGEGTGLGLALSHKIAHEHGGELWVESERGEGTRFHLDLPLAGPA